jgi:hypothetical protein
MTPRYLVKHVVIIPLLKRSRGGDRVADSRPVVNTTMCLCVAYVCALHMSVRPLCPCITIPGHCPASASAPSPREIRFIGEIARRQTPTADKPTSPAMDAIDTVSALDIAACILAVTEFITELLSCSQNPKVQPPLSLDGKDGHPILEALEELRTALSSIRLPSVPQQLGASAFRPLSNTSVLRELVSSRDATAALLDDIENILRRSPAEPNSPLLGTDTRARLRSGLAGTLYVEKLERPS